MAELLPALGAYLTSSRLEPLANALGETESGVAKALGSMGVTLLAAAMTPGSPVWAAAKNAHTVLTDQDFREPGRHFDAPITGLWDQWLGAPADALLAASAAFAGIKPASLASLKPLACVLVLTILKQTRAQGPIFLEAERSQILAKLPGNTAALLGLVKTPRRETPDYNWFYSLLLLLAMGAAIAYLLSNRY